MNRDIFYNIVLYRIIDKERTLSKRYACQNETIDHAAILKRQALAIVGEVKLIPIKLSDDLKSKNEIGIKSLLKYFTHVATVLTRRSPDRIFGLG